LKLDLSGDIFSRQAERERETHLMKEKGAERL
jgi:hypothetical protein